MMNAIKRTITIIGAISLVSAFSLVSPEKVIAQEPIEIIEINETVGIHTAPKLNNNGDVLWLTYGLGTHTLNYYDSELDTTSVVFTAEFQFNDQNNWQGQKIGQYNFNDLGDVVWEVWNREYQGGSYGNVYSVYYKVHDSEEITFLGYSKYSNLGSGAQSARPRINNNRVIVTQGLINATGYGIGA